MAGEWIEGKARECLGVFGGSWAELGGGILQGRCPGEGAHTKGGAETDARVFLTFGPNGEKPGCYCLHSSCKGVLDGMNEEFRNRIFSKDGRPEGSGAPRRNEGVVERAPKAREAWIPEYSEAKLRGLVRGVEPVGETWFMERSPVDVRGLTPGEYLEHVFPEGDRVLVFASFFSQGEYLWQVGKGGFRLSDERGVPAVRSKLPLDGGKDGVWYLCNPVDGQWHANPRRAGKFSRRSEEAVTAWRHLVLESDCAPEALWLKFLAMAPLGIVAIYSSGGKSWHALVRVDQPDKASFDGLLRDSIKRSIPLIGGDPGAMTPVRLTRLPGCTRGGREQRLIYLNPRVTVDAPPIRDLARVRSV